MAIHVFCQDTLENICTILMRSHVTRVAPVAPGLSFTRFHWGGDRPVWSEAGEAGQCRWRWRFSTLKDLERWLHSRHFKAGWRDRRWPSSVGRLSLCNLLATPQFSFVSFPRVMYGTSYGRGIDLPISGSGKGWTTSGTSRETCCQEVCANTVWTVIRMIRLKIFVLASV